MNPLPPLSCAHCGFAVFNRRYPKCERCGQPLPEGVAYSREERAALQQREDEEERARKARQRPDDRRGDEGDAWLFPMGPGGSSYGDGGGGGGGGD